MLLGQVEGARLNWAGGWDRVRVPPPPVPALFSQVDCRTVGEPVSQQASQFMNQSVHQTHVCQTLVGALLVGGSLL